MKVTKIKAAARDENRKLRVAAYCRVSTHLSEQEESLETQMASYYAMITENPMWEFAKVYHDTRTGLNAEKRKGFMQMMKDAMKGKIDLILCKSISRFSRNIVECQRYVDQLKMKNIVVIFEKEHIRTDDPTSTLMFALMAAIAQDESRSISDNMKTAIRHRTEQGIYIPKKNYMLGYDVKNGKYVPNKDAWVIRFIFEHFADGESTINISRELNALGARRLHSKKPFEHPVILTILKNETYVGDKLIQKDAPHDFITKRPDRTIPYESKYVQNDHEGIISRETWDRVQKRLAGMKDLLTIGARVQSSSHELHGKIVCGCCGAPYVRKSYHLMHREEPAYRWYCRESLRGDKGSRCRNPGAAETKILEAMGEYSSKMIKRITVEQDGTITITTAEN